MIKLCAWHPQYHGGHTIYGNTVDKEWRPMTEDVLKTIAEGVDVSHGLCEECFTIMKRETERDRRREAFVGPERIIVYCLEDGCDLTRWYDTQKWEDNKERSQAVVEGHKAIMGPYCCTHSAARKVVA